VKSGALDEGKQHMDQIRRLIGELDQAEGLLLSQRNQQAQQSAVGAQSTILWGTTIGTLLVVMAAFALSRTLTTQIGSAVQLIQVSSAELQAAANQQATGAKQQATAMSEVATTIGELLATSRQIAESARRVADIAGQTVYQARAGDGTVTRGTEAVDAIKRQVDVIVGNMLDLGKKSQQIGAVLDIVAELAEQTNILAINATIESAGAGDAGRRFGIVADEIRKLADRVGGSTKEIRALIDDVRAAVNTTVMTTETGSKAVDAGSNQFGQVATAFREISLQVGNATDAAKEIELSTKQQSTAVEQVNVAITSVAQASKERGEHGPNVAYGLRTGHPGSTLAQVGCYSEARRCPAGFAKLMSRVAFGNTRHATVGPPPDLDIFADVLGRHDNDHGAGSSVELPRAGCLHPFLPSTP
jgi:methyl-accepting chemotaxis protein